MEVIFTSRTPASATGFEANFNFISGASFSLLCVCMKCILRTVSKVEELYQNFHRIVDNKDSCTFFKCYIHLTFNVMFRTFHALFLFCFADYGIKTGEQDLSKGLIY